MKIHLLSGFLGSGKTTAIQQACQILLQQGIKASVITNDQGIRLVDADFFKSLTIPGRQVMNGCFCCNYNELDKNIESLMQTTNPDVIFAESVGSCTDIVATVMKPLLQYRKNISVTVSVFVDARLLYMLLRENRTLFDEEVNYIYYKQLEEAEIIIINKIDLMSQVEMQDLRLAMNAKYGQKKLLFQNSLDAGSLQQWLKALDERTPGNVLASLNINYYIYGAGEAKLAWLDQEISIYQTAHAAATDSIELVNAIYKSIRDKNYAIGHLKFLLNGKYKIGFTATSRDEPLTDYKSEKSNFASLLVNARVQTEPGILSEIVADAMELVKNKSGCSMVVESMSAFQPGYPRPTHRIGQ